MYQMWSITIQQAQIRGELLQEILKEYVQEPSVPPLLVPQDVGMIPS